MVCLSVFKHLLPVVFTCTCHITPSVIMHALLTYT